MDSYLTIGDLEIFKYCGTAYNSNCYIIWNSIVNEAVVVDPNCEAFVQDFVRLYPVDIKWIFVSHEHYDHLLAAKAIRENYGGQIVLTNDAQKALPKLQNQLRRSFNLHLHFTNQEAEAVPEFKTFEADLCFDQELQLKWHQHQFLLTQTKGHTKGSMCMQLDDKVIFSGDAILNGKPIVTKFLGGNMAEYNASTVPYFEKIKNDTWILPGHGEAFKKA